MQSIQWFRITNLSFIAEPHSEFKRCYEQQLSENHNYFIYSIFIVILKCYNVQKIDIQGL